MNTHFLCSVSWPDAATFGIPYVRASIAALAVTVAFLVFLKRLADEHVRLLKEAEEERRRMAEEEEAERRGAGKASHATELILLLSLVPALSPALVRAEDGGNPAPTLALGAWMETYISWNFNQPANGLTAFRGFDARHNTFALSNAVVDAHWIAGSVSGRLALQTGDTPDIYYGAESASDVRHILEATVAWKAPVGQGLTLDGGLFLSPIGPEGIAVKDNWNWSRSNLFYGLPFYHAGLRATCALSERWNLTGGVYNGWSNITDTNGKKSISLQGFYTKPGHIAASILYFGGVERPRGAPEGQPWRNLFDAHVTATISPRFSIQAHADTGFENTTFGRSSWRAAALAARVEANAWLYLAARADILDETIPASAAGTASALFFPTTQVRSLTATLDARPAGPMSVRLEFRHDSAADPLYFKGAPAAPSAKSQSTLTFGLTAWF